MTVPNYLNLRLFILLGLLLAASEGRSQSMDLKLLDKMNPNNAAVNPSWNLVSNSVSPLAYATPVTMFTVGLLTKDANLKRNALLTGAAVIANQFMTNTIKNSVQRIRPYNAFPDRITLEGSASGYSFPSGHTSLAFSMATSLTLSFKKWYVAVPAYGFAAATAYSRMYRGAHYPTDVLGGILVGTGTSYLTWKLQKVFYRKQRVMGSPALAD